MTRSPCSTARAALVRDGSDAAARAHAAACTACAEFGNRLRRVDAALVAAGTTPAPLPAALRARILAAAATPARRATPRGRLLDLAARAAAVAAVLVGGLWIAAEPVFAQDVDLAALRAPDFGIEEHLDQFGLAPRLVERVQAIPDIVSGAPFESPFDGAPVPAAAALAAVLALAAWSLPSHRRS